MKTEILKTYKICLLVKKIKKIRRDIPNYRYILNKRNQTLHNGKIDTDKLMYDFEIGRICEIFSIKREIIKLKNDI